MEPIASPLDFKLHHRAERWSVLIVRDVQFAHSKAAEVLERQIDAVFGVINADILPEVCKLQGRTGEIGKLLSLCVAISAEIENEVAYRIGRVVAVSENVVEGCEASDGLILAEGGQKIRKLMLRDIEFTDRFSQRDEYGMFRRSVIARLEFTLPLVEEFQRSRRIAD